MKNYCSWFLCILSIFLLIPQPLLAGDSQETINHDYRIIWETPFIDGELYRVGNLPGSNNAWPDYVVNLQRATSSNPRTYEIIYFDKEGKITQRNPLESTNALSDDLSHYCTTRSLIKYYGGMLEVTVKDLSGNIIGKTGQNVGSYPAF